jgi:hypothetical protein
LLTEAVLSFSFLGYNIETGYLPTGIPRSKPHIEKWVSEEKNSPDFLQPMISLLKPEKYKDKPLPKNLHLGITRLSSPFELLREYNFKAVLNELDELNQLIQTEYSAESASTAQSIPTVNEDLTAREMIERNTWFMLNNTGDGVELGPGCDCYEQIEEQESGRHKFWEFDFGVRQSEWAEFIPHQTWAKIRKYDAAFVEVDPKKMKYKKKNKELIDYSYYLPTKEIRKVSEQGVAKIEKSEISTKSEEHSQEAHHEETIDANPIIFESKQYRKQIKKVKGQGKNKPKVKTLASQHLQPVECAAEEVPVARLFGIEPCFIEKVFILAKPRSKRVDLKGVTREQLTNLPQVEDLRSFEVECLSKINSEDGLTKNMKRKGRKRIRKKVEEEKLRRELEINAEQESKMRMYMSLREEQINRDYGGRVMEADRYCGEGTIYEQYEHNYLDNEESKAILNDALTQRILRMEENLEQDQNRRIIQKCEILNSLLESFDGSTIKPLLNMLYEEYEVIDEPIQVQRTSDGVSQCNHR